MKALIRLPLNIVLAIFSHLKVFKWPLFLLWDPGSYKVKGDDMREVINLVRPGDLLLRGYRNYLDGYLIPGYFTHIGLFAGKIGPEHKGLVPEDAQHLFRTGEQMVIHSTTRGVVLEDILNFCRCDYMAILRMPAQLTPKASPVYSGPFDNEEEKRLFEKLQAAGPLSFPDVYPLIFRVAMSKLGNAYDFQYNFSDFKSLSCTEFVYYCLKSLEASHGITPLRQRILLLLKKKILAPDAFLSPNLQFIWKSRSAEAKKIPLHPAVEGRQA